MTLPTDPQERKKLQLYTFMFRYFPDAWLEVVRIARLGNDQHNPGQPLHWAREKSTDQMNAAFNHIFDYGQGSRIDTDGGYHLAKAVWRLMAQLQLDIESDKSKGQPKPVPGVAQRITDPSYSGTQQPGGGFHEYAANAPVPNVDKWNAARAANPVGRLHTTWCELAYDHTGACRNANGLAAAPEVSESQCSGQQHVGSSHALAGCPDAADLQAAEPASIPRGDVRHQI